MSTEEMLAVVDALAEQDMTEKLYEILGAVITKLDALDGRSADTDDMLDEIRAELEAKLS